MTDDEIVRLVQAAVTDLAASATAEIPRALGSLSTAIEENRQALATVAGAVAGTLLDRVATSTFGGSERVLGELAQKARRRNSGLR
jgi:hypothetical protein